MPFHYKHKFTIKHDKAHAFHIGAFLCIDPYSCTGKKEIYLFLCFGKHDFSIGFLDVLEEAE